MSWQVPTKLTAKARSVGLSGSGSTPDLMYAFRRASLPPFISRKRLPTLGASSKRFLRSSSSSSRPLLASPPGVEAAPNPSLSVAAPLRSFLRKFENELVGAVEAEGAEAGGPLCIGIAGAEDVG